MERADMEGDAAIAAKYRLLRSKLDEAYKAPLWDSEWINRIADEISPLARQLASLQARGMRRQENDRA